MSALYLEHQKEWLRGVKDGDKVTITRKAENHEFGWENVWVTGMSKYIGKTVTLRNIGWANASGLYIKEEGSGYPFFIFEKMDDIKSLDHIIKSIAESIIKLAGIIKE